MRLKNISIKQLYERDFDINFKDDLTILYGLNGSGKTTIINIIYHILKGEINKVLEYKFLTLELIFEKDGKERRFIIENFGDEINCTLDNQNFQLANHGNDFDFILQRSSINDDESNDYFFDENVKEKYKILSSIKRNDGKKEKQINEELKSLTDIVYIPLNRKVKGVEEIHVISKNNHRLSSVRSNKMNIEDSLVSAQRYYETHKTSIIHTENRINVRMRSEMIHNFSRPIDTADLLNNRLDEFTNLNKELRDIIGIEISENINQLLNIYNYTSESYKILDGNIKIIDVEKFIEHSSALVQLNKLREVSNIAKKEKGIIDKYKKNLEQVLDSINSLFLETGKKIAYDEKQNKLYFSNLKNSNNKYELNVLSSGEKQIVIFFIFALINYKRNQSKLLLIDEPEISLHIEWQAQLLPLILNNNYNSQIIIATHSPDIIGDYQDMCVEVKGK